MRLKNTDIIFIFLFLVIISIKTTIEVKYRGEYIRHLKNSSISGRVIESYKVSEGEHIIRLSDSNTYLLKRFAGIENINTGDSLFKVSNSRQIEYYKRQNEVFVLHRKVMMN
jgi:hypothetical protein